MRKQTFIVGDIHAEWPTLHLALEKNGFNAEYDSLYCIGDLGSKGAYPIETLDYILSLKHVRVVLGNHDLELLAVLEGVKLPYQDKNYSQVLEWSKKDELQSFLKRQTLYICDEKAAIILTHAGLHPQLSKQMIMKLDARFCNQMQQPDARQFFEALFKQGTASLMSCKSNMDEMVFYANAMTCMRYLHEKTFELDLSNNQMPSAAYKPYIPWYEAARHPSLLNYDCYFGHWSRLQGVNMPKKVIKTDYGCTYGGALCLINLTQQTQSLTPWQPSTK